MNGVLSKDFLKIQHPESPLPLTLYSKPRYAQKIADPETSLEKPIFRI
jgi:hypothetical protein